MKPHYFIAILLLSLTSFGFSQAKYKIGEVELVNMDSSYSKVIYELMKIELENLRLAAGDNEPAETILPKAISTNRNAKLYIKVTNGNKITWTDSITINTPDDLDRAIQRLLGNLARRDTTKPQSIHQVTKLERNPLRKMKTTNYFGVNIGLGGTTNNSHSVTRLGAFFLWDLRDVLAEGFIQSAKNKEFRMTMQGIQVLYPFTYESQSLYAGGGMTLVTYEDDTTRGYNGASDGIGLRFSAGYFYGRTMDVLVRGELGVTVIKVDDHPTDAEISLGIGLGSKL